MGAKKDLRGRSGRASHRGSAGLGVSGAPGGLEEA